MLSSTMPAQALPSARMEMELLTVVTKTADGHYKVLQTVPTKVTARTMALDPASHTIYLSAAETEGFDPPNENTQNHARMSNRQLYGVDRCPVWQI